MKADRSENKVKSLTLNPNDTKIGLYRLLSGSHNRWETTNEITGQGRHVTYEPALPGTDPSLVENEIELSAAELADMNNLNTVGGRHSVKRVELIKSYGDGQRASYLTVFADESGGLRTADIDAHNQAHSGAGVAGKGKLS